MTPCELNAHPHASRHRPTASGTIFPVCLLESRSGRGAQTGLNHHGRAGMKHWHLGLLAAATASFVTSSAQAAPDFRVIRWDFTRICQIYDFGWGGRPIPSNYRVHPILAEFPRRSARRRATWRVTAAARSNRSINSRPAGGKDLSANCEAHLATLARRLSRGLRFCAVTRHNKISRRPR